jgi:hypothetical protein
MARSGNRFAGTRSGNFFGPDENAKKSRGIGRGRRDSGRSPLILKGLILKF